MRPMSRYAVAIGLGTFVALGAACTDVGAPFFIVQNTVPGDGCSVSASSIEFRARGIIDANAGAGYVFTPVVRSTAGSDADESLRIVFVEGADIDIDIQSGFAADGIPSELTSFSKRFSGAIQPGGTTAFAFTIIPEQLLTDYILPSLGEELLELGVTVRMFGQYGGGDVEAQPFTYWVDVCNGCMKQNVGACDSLASDFVASAGGECVLLQDVPLECCTQADSTELCPAVPTGDDSGV